MRPSMSRKGNCYDNAPVESFWGTMKEELVYHGFPASETMVDVTRLRCHGRSGYLHGRDVTAEWGLLLIERGTNA